MFINPQTAIKNGWITGIVNPEKQVQPNAIDFTADKAFKLSRGDVFYVSERHKQMRGSVAYEPEPTNHEPEITNSWLLAPGGMLDFLSDIYVDLPRGVAAMLVIRSTLARNGLILVSGLYDSGFKGHIGFLLHNRHENTAVIAEGTRVGQIIFVESDAAGVYSGGYNHEMGTNAHQEPEYPDRLGGVLHGDK